MSLNSGLDLLILILYANDGTEIRGRTRLMKMLFLMIKEGGFQEFEDEFVFKEDNFGPSSSKVYNFIATGQETGLIKKETQPRRKTVETADAREKKSLCKKDREETDIFSLTSDGKKVGEALVKQINQEKWEAIKSIKQKFNELNLFDFIKYVYRNYPAFARKSELEEIKAPDVSKELLGLVGVHSPLSLKEEKEQIQDYIDKKYRGKVKK